MALPEAQLDAVLLACLSNDNSIRLQVCPPPMPPGTTAQPGPQASGFRALGFMISGFRALGIQGFKGGLGLRGFRAVLLGRRPEWFIVPPFIVGV